jgi:hypothetical protein
MLCKRCDGRGSIWYDEDTYAKCPECIGGVVSCCEVTDEPVTNFSEPLLKGSKKYTETFEFKKPPPKTGYEIQYNDIPPIETISWTDALKIDIIEILTGKRK